MPIDINAPNAAIAPIVNILSLFFIMLVVAFEYFEKEEPLCRAHAFYHKLSSLWAVCVFVSYRYMFFGSDGDLLITFLVVLRADPIS